MAEVRIDPFVSTEPEVEIDAETHRVLQERIKSSDEGDLVSSEEAREKFRKWLSNSSTTQTR